MDLAPSAYLSFLYPPPFSSFLRLDYPIENFTRNSPRQPTRFSYVSSLNLPRYCRTMDFYLWKITKYRVEGKGYHRWILHFRFDGDSAAKLTLTLNFKNFVYFTYHEGKTFSRNHRSQPDSSFEKWQQSFLVIYYCNLNLNLNLTATLWFRNDRITLFYYFLKQFLCDFLKVFQLSFPNLNLTQT